MILRRFTNHITDQNWFAVGLDLLVVITGIFLGLQVTEWNENRKENALGFQYQQSYLEDLGSDITDLRGRIEYQEIQIGYGLKIREAFEGKSGSISAEETIIALYLLSMNWFYSANEATKDELISSGKLHLLGDKEMRNSVMSYYRLTEDMLRAEVQNDDFRIFVRSMIPLEAQEVIEVCDATIFDQHNVVGANFSDCDVNLENWDSQEILAEIMNEPDARKHLTFRLSHLSASNRATKIMLEGAKTVTTRLGNLAGNTVQ